MLLCHGRVVCLLDYARVDRLLALVGFGVISKFPVCCFFNAAWGWVLAGCTFEYIL